LHSQIRTPWNSNNDLDLFTWIGEQPCMQMDFRQFSRNAYIHIIPGKLSENHLHTLLFSNSCGQVRKSINSRGQICPILLRRKRTNPRGLENNHECKSSLDNFPGIIPMSAFLENYQKSIGMQGCSPIQVERSESVLEFHGVRIWECNIRDPKNIFQNWPPSALCLGHPWGNFCWDRFRINILLKLSQRNSKLKKSFMFFLKLNSTPIWTQNELSSPSRTGDSLTFGCNR
jgi:hypothetical protein